MIFTVNQVLVKENIEKQETLYFQQSDEFFEYPMAMGNFFESSNGLHRNHEFEIDAWITEQIEQDKKNQAYVLLQQEKKRLQEKMHAAKSRTEIHQFRLQIKDISEKIRQAETMYAENAIHGYYQKNEIAGHQIVIYKHHLMLNSLKNIQRILPELQDSNLRWLQNIPIFTENMHELRVLNKDKLAIEGGPCLFGTDEVDLLVVLQDGMRFTFDCDSGVCVQGECTLHQAAFFQEYREKISEITFVCRKDGFSVQEVELFEAMFSIASALHCRLLISLPDMAYKKYFCEIIKPLSTRLQQRAIENYTKVLHQITDLYLAAIEIYKKRYPIMQMEVLHERNHVVYETFLRERSKYCALENVTTCNEERRSSIYDYICMPATPHYLWNTPHILEINSTDEADSVRKCIKYHKKSVHFHQMMLPEKVSADGKTTVFRALRAQKGYRRLHQL